MNKPPAKAQAGGKKRGLSIVLEGADSKIISELSKLVAIELSKRGNKTASESTLRNYEENVLVANQYLLDTASAPLSPETLSLMVVIKLRERLKKAQVAKSNGEYVISNTSWLGDAYYYELRGKKDVSQQIITDCCFMKPDVWVVVDEPSGIYARLAKQTGITVLSPKLSTQRALNIILEQIKKAEKVLPVALNEQKQTLSNTQKLSFLASTKALADPRNSILATTLPDKKLTYYRPKNFGKKVLGAYDLINNKLIENYQKAVADLSKYFATQALRNQKPFKVEVLKNKATKLCFGLLPVSTILTVETTDSQKYSELTPKTSNVSQELYQLLPNIDAERPRPEIVLTGHSPRNEFEILEYLIFKQSNHSPASIKKLIDDLSYEKKSELLKSYTKHENIPNDTQSISYSFDAVGEFSQLYDLLKTTPVNNVVLQNLTPRYGYDIPQLIEEAGISDIFEQSFDLSLELYSLLQAAGFEAQAQYAVLMGHLVRFHLDLNYEQTKKLISKNIRSASSGIKQQVSDVHPLLWD